MTTLYEIDKSIMDCIDVETGEVIDPEKLNELQIQREEKIEGVVLWLKNLKAELTMLKAEKDAFAEREKQTKNKIEGLQNWLTHALDGQKFSTAKCAVSFRKSESVEIEEESKIPKKFFVKKITLSPDKIAIKDAIKAGKKVGGCSLLEKLNPQIK